MENITLENLAAMIKRGFDENTEQHQRVFDQLGRIEKKLEGIVYRREFEELEIRVKLLEELLIIKKGK